jgi:hypothetical protein
MVKKAGEKLFCTGQFPDPVSSLDDGQGSALSIDLTRENA